jgi:hypothetical protein
MDEEYEYPIKFVSRGEEAQSLAAFKQRVMTELTVSRFTTPEDLASKVYEDLKRELPRETLENQANLRENVHAIAGAHWDDGQ